MYFQVLLKKKSFKIKRIFSISVISILIFFTFCDTALPALAEAEMASAVLNSSNGRYITGKNDDQVLPVASLTKLMTALVLLSLSSNLTKKVTITKAEINYTIPYIAKGDVTSKIEMKAGDKVTRNDLWNAMLIASSNEAAIALVDNSGLTRTQFVHRMNSKAKAFGLRHTKFYEPTGIDPGNVSTAIEMAIIARRAYAQPLIRQTSAKPSYLFKDLNTGRKISIYSRNNSLLAMNPLGMKVGYLTEAKMNVALRLKKSGKDRIVVILHALNNAHRNAEIYRLMSKQF